MVKARLPDNARITLRLSDADWYSDPQGSYVQAAYEGGPWDVVVIDGVGRNDCAAAASDLVLPDGLVVLDDTHNPLLVSAQEHLRKQGFGRIDFWGLRPGSSVEGATSVFSKDFNRWLLPTKIQP